MNDAEFEVQKERFRSLVETWKSRLGLHVWDFEMDWQRGPFEVNGEMTAGIAGAAIVRWEYVDATLKFNLESCATLSDEEAESLVVHELMHVFLKELQHVTDDWLKHEERVAAMLERAFMFTLKDGAHAS